MGGYPCCCGGVQVGCCPGITLPRVLTVSFISYPLGGPGGGCVDYTGFSFTLTFDPDYTSVVYPGLLGAWVGNGTIGGESVYARLFCYEVPGFPGTYAFGIDLKCDDDQFDTLGYESGSGFIDPVCQPLYWEFIAGGAMPDCGCLDVKKWAVSE